MREFWTVFSRAGGSSLGLLQRCTALAGERGLKSCAVVVSPQLEEGDAELICACGAKKIYYIPADDERIDSERVVRDCLVKLCREGAAQAVIFECSSFFAEVAPAAAVELNLGITADCTQLRWDESWGLLQIRPTFGGRKLAVNRSVFCPYIATVRRGVFPYTAPELKGKKPEICRLPVDVGSPLLKFLGFEERLEHRGGLETAEIIVSGGLGVGSRENFRQLKELAELLGGELGASRGAVAAGFASYGHQVGQTGVSVRPRVYLAFGISGAVQHLSGILGAGKIIAINHDPRAPIHDYSDFSIIADCNETAARLTEEIKRGKK